MVTLAQAVLADLGEGDVHVVRARQVAGGPDERVVVEDVQDARDGDQDVVLGDLRLVAELLAATTAPTAVAVTAPATATAARLVVVAVVLLLAALALLLAATALLLALAALLLVVALAAAVALTVTAVTAVAALTALAALLAVAAPFAVLLRGRADGGLGLGVRLCIRLDVDGRVALALGPGVALGLRAARLGGGTATAALSGRLVVSPEPAAWAVPPAGCPGMSICCWAVAFSALLSAAAAESPVRALEVARRFGLVSASPAPASALLGADALAGAPLPDCASLMTSISWLLRIRAVPLMPRPDATCCSSARTMPSRPVPERRRREVVPEEAAPPAGAEVSTLLSAVTPIRSVVSLTKGPSLERTSAFWLGDRLCCPATACDVGCRRTLPGRWSRR